MMLIGRVFGHDLRRHQSGEVTDAELLRIAAENHKVDAFMRRLAAQAQRERV